MQDSLDDYIRISKNAKTESETINEVLITEQIKKECDSKAMQIIQFAIEGKLRSQALLRCLPFINQSHYQDIVEERAITQLCGYPLCGKQIPDMPKKQFHIATKSNKVYDITDRKNYCSNYCYKASIHIKKQIDNNPLWLRKHDKVPQYTVLNQQEKGIPGEMVHQGTVKINSTHYFTSITDFANFSLDEAEENELVLEENELKKPKRPPKKVQKGAMKTIAENEEDQGENEEPVRILKQESTKVEISKPIEIRKPLEVQSQQDAENLIRKSFKEWINLETFIFIYGEEFVKSRLNSEKVIGYFDSLKISELQLEQQKRYMDICRKLRMKELAEDRFDTQIVGNQLKSIPDYQQLKSEGRELDSMVKSFYSGDIQIKENKAKQLENNKVEKEEGPPIVLPFADVNSQVALRRRIYMNSLSKTMSTLLQKVGVSPVVILSQVQHLVKTFKLKADNIVFKPHIWNAISIILLKILSIKDQNIADLINGKKFQETIEVSIFAEEIVEAVKDLDRFVQDYITCKEIN